MDVVFFLKTLPPKSAPAGVRYVALDPPAQFMCAGADIRCSSAYAAFILSLKDEQGRFLPRLKAKYAPGANKVAFVGFSAAHGFLNPLLNNDQDLAEIDSVYLLDATFGGGKHGFIKAAQRAAEGNMLLVSPTSNTGGDAGFRSQVLEPAGLMTQLEPVPAMPPMPTPSGGVWRVGRLWYYRFVDSEGGTELPHWAAKQWMELQKHMLVAHPPFAPPQPERSWTWGQLVLAAGAGVGAYWVYRRWRT